MSVPNRVGQVWSYVSLNEETIYLIVGPPARDAGDWMHPIIVLSHEAQASSVYEEEERLYESLIYLKRMS